MVGQNLDFLTTAQCLQNFQCRPVAHACATCCQPVNEVRWALTLKLNRMDEN